jgi:lipopolysaccharide export LptBFGC system permease protein LptF
MIFTLFDLLRFIARQNTTAWLIARYLFFIIPYASLILAPMALLVSTLATYAILARRSEAIAWWAGGQSVYRLAVPGLLFAIALSTGMWLTQEGPLPQANRIQNRLRAQIRGGTALMATPAGRQWLASPDQRRIYTYFYNEASERLSELVVFEFDGEGVYLDKVIIGEGVEWGEDGKMLIQGARVFNRSGGVITTATAESYPIEENRNVFKPVLNSPPEMSFKQLSEHLKRLRLRGVGDSPSSRVALERKRADPSAPIILALIGIPLAFAYGKRNAVVALCVAVLIGISFWGSISAFHLLGVRGVLPPPLSAWSPAAIFGAVGIYLFTRAKT